MIKQSVCYLAIALAALLAAGCANNAVSTSKPAAADGSAVTGTVPDPAAPGPNESNTDALERFLASQDGPVDPRSAADIDAALFTFRYDPAVSRRLRQELAKDQPQLAEALEAITLEAQQDFIDRLFPGRGLRATNVADAAAVGIATAFYHYQDTKTTTAAQGMIVRDQMKVALSRATRLPSASDAEKQTFAETMVYGALMLAGSAPPPGAPDDPQAQAALKRNAAIILRRVRIDPDRYALTQRGITPR